MKVIMIILMFSNGKVATSTAEFNTMQACDYAKTQAVASVPKNYQHITRITCNPKGKE